MRCLTLISLLFLWWGGPVVAAPITMKNKTFFASMRASHVNVRRGPATTYRVSWTLENCTGMPIEILESHGNWLHIRDWKKLEGWVHKSMVSVKRKTLVVLNDGTSLRVRPCSERNVIASMRQGVFLTCLKKKDGWCYVKIHSYEGWVDKRSCWGGD